MLFYDEFVLLARNGPTRQGFRINTISILSVVVVYNVDNCILTVENEKKIHFIHLEINIYFRSHCRRRRRRRLVKYYIFKCRVLKRPADQPNPRRPGIFDFIYACTSEPPIDPKFYAFSTDDNIQTRVLAKTHVLL